jgi:sugar lactone lactonase YvrE
VSGVGDDGVVTATTLCPRCGAPIPWDGIAKTVNCPYCKVVVQALAVGAPPPARHPAMVTPQSGGGGTGCIIAGVAVAVVAVVVAAGGALLFVRSGSATTSPVVVVPSFIIAPTFSIPATSTAKATTTALRVFGEEGNGPGQLTDGRSIAVDIDENVYVADYADGRVQKLDPNGKFQWIIQVPKNAFSGDDTIFGMAVDTKNVLWVARTGDLLQYQTADGKALKSIKGNYDTTWFRWIAIDPVGNVATTHDAAGDSDLLLLDPTGKLKKRVKNKEPAGLAMDGAGNVYLSERFDNVIEVIDPTGNVKSRFGSKKDKHTSGVDALAVDGKGHIFASTSEGINVFDQGGAYVTSLGTKELHGAVRSIAVSSKNHLFVLGGEKIAVLDLGTLP